MRNGPRAVGALLLFALLATFTGCNKQSDLWLPETPMVSEGVLACEAMLNRFDTIDVETATEAELDAAMRVAGESYERCDRQFRGAAQTRADHAFYSQRSDQVRIYELLFEGTLSRRFDNMTGYCVILRDMVRVLARSIENMDDAFDNARLSEDDVRRLGELYQLDLQSLELLSVQLSVTCDGNPPPRANPREPRQPR